VDASIGTAGTLQQNTVPGVQKLNQRGLGVKISKLSSYKMSPLCSVADQDPGSGAFLTPGSGMGKRSGSGMNIPDNISENLETIFWVKKT
jgi:hypothetical protein